MADKLGKRFIEMMDETATHEQVAKLVETLLIFFKKFKTEMEQNMALHKGEMSKELKDAFATLEDTKTRLSSAVEDGKNLTRSEARTITRLLQQEIRRVENLIPDPADLSPLEARIEEKAKELEAKIPSLPEELKPKGIRDKLESLQGNERVKIEAVADLREELKKLNDSIDAVRQMRGGRFSGGTSAMGVASAMGFAGRTETPSGAINSSNVTYTVTKPINFIFSFMINGQSIPSADYSVSGRTITMDTALDSSLSGTEFEIKYI